MKKFFIGWSALAGLCSCSPQGSGTLSATLPQQLEQGKTLYEQSCAQCHYDGSGSPTAPPLLGSEVLAQPPRALARVILEGRRGESLRGNEKFNGIMPPQPYLSDAEIAAIVAYVRDAFGSRREKVSVDEVTSVRASLQK